MHFLLLFVGERSRDEVNPVGAPGDRPRRQERPVRRRSVRSPPQTAKPPLVWRVAQARRVSIPLQIPADSKKVVIILDGEGLESARIPLTVSGGAIMRMMALGGRQIQPLTESARDLPFFAQSLSRPRHIC